jgi:outer membrane lipoprotein
MKRFFMFVIVLVLISGCAHAISRGVRKEVDKEVTFLELIKTPTAYEGKVVLLGGVIVNTINKEEGTLLEVYQTKLDSEERPTDTDRSEGRFLALYEGYLDSEIYKQGRQVTIAGTVQGAKVKPLGEIEYHYPYLLVKEIHLWKEEEPIAYEPYPWGGWYDPWYPWGWYSPWWYHRHYHRHPRHH